MKNDLLTIGPVTIHGYGLMIGIGVIAAYLTAEYRAKKLKLDPDQVFSKQISGHIQGVPGKKGPIQRFHLDAPLCWDYILFYHR